MLRAPGGTPGALDVQERHRLGFRIMMNGLPMSRLCAAFAILMLVVVACGGGDDDDTDGRETPVPTEVELTGAAAEFAALLDTSLGSTFEITYMTASDEGPGDAFVVTSAPPMARIDTIPADLAEPLSAIVVDGEGRTIGCGDGPDNWECVEIDPLGDSVLNAAGPAVYYSPADLANFDVTEIDGRELAGEAARCFLLAPVDDTAERGETTYCVADDGLPLFTESQFGTVEATELSRTVSDDAFILPADLSE